MHLNLNLNLNLPFWVYLESYGFFFSFLNTALDCAAKGFIFYSPSFLYLLFCVSGVGYALGGRSLGTGRIGESNEFISSSNTLMNHITTT